jgi:hypothetical protein
MSVDERIRSAFGEPDESWEHRSGEALREVGRRHARGIVLRRGLAATALAAAVVAGAVLVGTDRFGDNAAPDPVGPPTPPTQTDPPPSGASASVLEGRWRTALLDEDDVRAALEQAGNGQYADRVLPVLRPAPFRLVWLVTYETAELRLVSRDGSEALDKITLAVEGDQVTLAPRFGDGSTVHRFAITDDELRLTFVSTTEGVEDGVPGEVWQRLLYGAVPFARP